MGEKKDKKYKLYEYKDDDGNFSYDMYKDIQVKTNKKKLERVWVKKESIEILCKEFPNAKRVLCHGTRRGKEQEFFKDFLDCYAIGTEISDTAESFPDTIEWDFHNVKEEWVNSFDIVYSNSFDHSYKPEECLKAWVECIKDDGVVVLEFQNRGHGIHSLSASDPFACQRDDMPEFINECGEGKFYFERQFKSHGKHTYFLIIKKTI